ncbi:MAG: molybdopterin molybdotransferase MoeA [Lachnospiraceae bacterium]|jgi:molybdopterin molybdotransferase|nr:molybdopterin molybdotransferase MoeA [Lachnospiraceae bacterium]
MLQIEDAVRCLQQQMQPITKTQNLPLLTAAGWILAQEGRAMADQPPFPRSPLDGYALRGQDTEAASKEAPVCLQVVGRVYAGEVFPGQIKAGEAVRIMTGAPIPMGADTVVRQEDSDYGQEQVLIYKGSRPYENYCFQGEDYKKDSLLLQKGAKLGGCEIALAASLGMDPVAVYQKPKIAVISTGDELTKPGEKLMPGKIYDSNRYWISGRLAELGILASYSGQCKDEPEEMAECIRRLSEQTDLIITTGGVSVGEKDILHEVIRRLSARQLFWQVNVKPGAPVLAAVLDQTLLICLSGNPFAAAVNFELIVRPVIGYLSRDKSWIPKRKKVRLENDYRKPAGARRFLRGYEEDGKAWVATGNHAAGALSAMAGCNCLIEILPQQAGAVKGDTVWACLL